MSIGQLRSWTPRYADSRGAIIDTMVNGTTSNSSAKKNLQHNKIPREKNASSGDRILATNQNDARPFQENSAVSK